MKDHEISTEEVYADDLTWREQEVLILLSERLTNREIGAQQYEAWALGNLGLLAYYRDDQEIARQYTQEALKMAQEIGHQTMQGAMGMGEVFLPVTTCKTHTCESLNLDLIIMDEGNENYGLACGTQLS